MSPASLIRHHAGRMAGPARWYLAGLGVVSLLLLTAHFAVQEHVQKTLRQAVHVWLQDQGGDVRHVRYRLLRGALTLEGVRWTDGAGVRLDAESILVSTSSRAMLSSSPEFSRLDVERPVLSLPAERLSGWLRGEPGPVGTLTSLLVHARVVNLQEMTLRVGGTAPDSPGRVLLKNAHGYIETSAFSIGGMLGAGQFQLDVRTGRGGGLNGTLRLDRAEVDELALLSGSQAFEPGLVASGVLALRGDWSKRDIGVEGRLGLSGGPGEAALGIRGGWSATGADIDLACENLQLTSLPFGWPEFAGRILTSARLTGVMHLQHNWREGAQAEANRGGWRIGIDGSLRGVQLAAEALPTWDIGSMRIRRGRLMVDSGALVAEELRLEDADIRLNMHDIPGEKVVSTSPRIARLEFSRVRPQLRFPDESVMILPAMSGGGQLQAPGGGGKLRLADSAAGERPVGGRSVEDQADGDDPDEAWKVELTGDPFADWQATVDARRVPLVRLRPLLPLVSLPREKGVPEYSGLSDFSLRIVPVSPGIELSGRAAVSDARMLQGGDQFSAERIEVDIRQADSDGTRHLSRLHIRGWHYQMALRPLPRMAPGHAATDSVAGTVPGSGTGPDTETEGAGTEDGSPEVVQGVIEWTAPMRDAGWQVDVLQAEEGSISLGQPDALAGENLSLNIHGLKSGELAPFTLNGVLGGGELRVGGKLQWQPEFGIEAKARLSHALPFMFNDWMRLSGMPRFVRGRLDAKFSLHRRGSALAGGYAGEMDIHGRQLQLEAGVFPDDPMLSRSGYTTQGLLERLNHPRAFKLSMSFRGSWKEDGLVDVVGAAGLAALKRTAAGRQAALITSEPSVSRLVRLRLRGKRGFSYNERVRLRKMIRTLQADSHLVVELSPQLGAARADAAMVGRVRDTQQQVERYLNRMGVPSRRIFPVWPQDRHRHGDAPGLLLRARAP